MTAVSEVQATVRRIEPGAVWVEIVQQGCGRCHEQGGCGGQKLTQALCAGPKNYRVETSSTFQPGDHVTLAIPSQQIRRGASYAYVFPLVGLIAGAILGMALAEDPGAIAGGVSGLLLTWCLVRRRLRAAFENPSLSPYLLS